MEGSMKMRRKLLTMLLPLLPLLAANAVRAEDVAKLGWLEGHWSGSSRGIAMEELWTSAEGGGLVGLHKDSKGGKIVSYEFFRIVPDDSGRVCYLASPLGRPPVPFCARSLGSQSVTFENAGHDFPQRIRYWLDAQDRLHARIEGTISGSEKSEEWTWRRRR
jgi:hypothetical protein